MFTSLIFPNKSCPVRHVIDLEDKELLLMGDLNCDVRKFSSDDHTSTLQFLSTGTFCVHQLKQLINEPNNGNKNVSCIRQSTKIFIIKLTLNCTKQKRVIFMINLRIDLRVKILKAGTILITFL